MKYPTREQGRAVTSVFWDINLCPVPSGFDPSRVRPCIKQYLENRGYSHLVNITAVGVLVDVPARVLRSVFSSGISLINVPYGDTSGVVCAFAENNPPSEANIMVISDPNIFTGVSDYLGYTGHHLLEPCPYDSLQSLVEKDSGAPDEETVESALWDCLVCRRDPPSHVFEDLITHLHGEEHEELFQKRFARDDVDLAPPAVSRRDPFMTWDWCPLLSGPRVTKQEAATFVFWDINTYPVPCCSDVPLVAPCIKRFLAVEGYFGPCVIVAAGLLTDVPVDILRALSSCGITLTNLPYGFSSDIVRLLFEFVRTHKVAANFMVISVAKIHEVYDRYLKLWEYNLLPPFPYASLQSFLPADPERALEEYTCSSETGESSYWFCSLCYPALPYKGFDNFATHISSAQHRSQLLDPLPISECDEKSKEAVTYVFWDIIACPLPPSFDPRLVGPSIKAFLERSGYSGTVKITAVGALTDVPHDILRGLFYGGISLESNSGCNTIALWLTDYALGNPSPANFMVICDPGKVKTSFRFLSMEGKSNLLQYDSVESFLPTTVFLDEEGDKRKRKRSEMGEYAGCVCSDCCPGDVEEDFEKFSTHLSSRAHKRRMLDFLPYNARFSRQEDASYHGGHDSNIVGKVQETEGVNKNTRNKKMKKNIHMNMNMKRKKKNMIMKKKKKALGVGYFLRPTAC